jgi:hypothetical protein
VYLWNLMTEKARTQILKQTQTQIILKKKTRKEPDPTAPHPVLGGIERGRRAEVLSTAKFCRHSSLFLFFFSFFFLFNSLFSFFSFSDAECVHDDATPSLLVRNLPMDVKVR